MKENAKDGKGMDLVMKQISLVGIEVILLQLLTNCQVYSYFSMETDMKEQLKMDKWMAMVIIRSINKK